MHKETDNRAGWRVREWASATGICATSTFALLKAGKLRSVAVGNRRIILTSPREFLENVAASGGEVA